MAGRDHNDNSLSTYVFLSKTQKERGFTEKKQRKKKKKKDKAEKEEKAKEKKQCHKDKEKKKPETEVAVADDDYADTTMREKKSKSKSNAESSKRLNRGASVTAPTTDTTDSTHNHKHERETEGIHGKAPTGDTEVCNDKKRSKKKSKKDQKKRRHRDGEEHGATANQHESKRLDTQGDASSGSSRNAAGGEGTGAIPNGKNACDPHHLPPHEFVLAPMVGGSELPFRMLCRRYGADLCYTPMM